MKFSIFLILGIFLLSFISAQQINPEDYKTEFNNEGEICSIKDALFYTDSGNKLSFVTFYNCCSDDNCLEIPFDVMNKRGLDLKNLEESFNIEFTRENIKNGNLIPSNHFPESFDFCSYFSEKLPEQSRNLAVKTADNMEEFAPKNYKKIYQTMKGVGFATGVISEFEIGIFFVGVGCNKLSKQENEAFFKVAECYSNLQSIESGTTHYGISSQTYICMQNADFLLNEVLESWGQKVKGTVNKVIGVGKSLWDLGKNFAEGNLSAKLEITETSYESAKRIKNKLNVEKSYLTNPNSLILSENAQMRLFEKQSLAESEYNSLQNNYSNVGGKIPTAISEFFSNLIYSPNIYNNNSRYFLKEAKLKLNIMDDFIEASKYNSALSLEESIDFYINKSLSSYILLSEIEREIDLIPIIFWSLIFGTLISLSIRYFK